MAKEVRGVVLQNPIVLERCCLFTVEQDGGTYLILSTDRQASKDNIFVEQGQEIHIQGSGIEDMNFKGVIVTEQAQINIRADSKEK